MTNRVLFVYNTPKLLFILFKQKKVETLVDYLFRVFRVITQVLYDFIILELLHLYFCSDCLPIVTLSVFSNSFILMIMVVVCIYLSFITSCIISKFINIICFCICNYIVKLKPFFSFFTLLLVHSLDTKEWHKSFQLDIEVLHLCNKW